MPKLLTVKTPPSLNRIAYEALRDSILNGHLRSGELYSEMALASELGISRTPVREALLELSVQGLVTFLPRKGVIINHFTERDVEEIFEVRKAIELAVVEMLAKKYEPEDLSAIEKTLIEQRKAAQKKNYSLFLQADRDFHTLLARLTNNRRLIAILDNIRDMIQLMGLQALSQEGRLDEVIAEHEQIIEALKQTNPEEARERMDRHLDRSRKAVLEQETAQSSQT